MNVQHASWEQIMTPSDLCKMELKENMSVPLRYKIEIEFQGSLRN